jgi:hypothetical protein
MFRHLLAEDLEYASTLPEKSYQANKFAARNTKWPQRKQLLAEIHFLTKYLDPKLSQTVIYLGGSPGKHLELLVDFFAGITFLCFDSAGYSGVVSKERLILHARTISEDEIETWRGRAYLIIDLKTNQAEDYQAGGEVTATNVRRRRIDDLTLQRRYYTALQPIKGLLTFIPPYPKENGKRELFQYLDGQGYFVPWAGNNSTEIKLVPFSSSRSSKTSSASKTSEANLGSSASKTSEANLGSSASKTSEANLGSSASKTSATNEFKSRLTDWDLLRHERIMFFHNDVERRTKTFGNVYSESSALDPPELLQDWDSSAEIVILGEYGQRVGIKGIYQLREFIKTASQRITALLNDRNISARRKHQIKTPMIYVDIKEVLKRLTPETRVGMRPIAPLEAPKESQKLKNFLRK